MKSPPESTTIEELMARRSSTNLQRDLVRILKRPEFMSEFVASHLSAYAGRDYQELRDWFVKQLLEKCTSLWPQCPLLAQKLLFDKALNAKFWGELYGSRALLRAVAQLKPLTWEDLGLPNSSEALASILPPEKLKFTLRRKSRKDAQEFTKRPNGNRLRKRLWRTGIRHVRNRRRRRVHQARSRPKFLPCTPSPLTSAPSALSPLLETAFGLASAAELGRFAHTSLQEIRISPAPRSLPISEHLGKKLTPLPGPV